VAAVVVVARCFPLAEEAAAAATATRGGMGVCVYACVWDDVGSKQLDRESNHASTTTVHTHTITHNPHT
jgi:hypothetical protein